MSTTTNNPYDAMPYVGQPFTQTHPARLAAMARLFGRQPPNVATCRVLELGCASGENLIPLAVAMPDARFVGVDLSARQVAAGQQIIGALGLRNIAIEQRDIADVGPADGSFDYIIAHGVYSWVPAPIRDKVLAICSANLAATGVAYVSYKTLPGWSLHGVLREMMLLHAKEGADPAQRMREARRVLDTFAANAASDTPYGALLREQVDLLRGEPDAYLFHDHLEPVSHPVYFHQFVAEAGAHGLQFMAEAGLGAMGPGQVTPQAAAALRTVASDFLSLEQLVDVLINRSFRQSLLVHAGAVPVRQALPEAVATFAIASSNRAASRAPSLAAGMPEVFHAPNGGTFTSSLPMVKAALVLLAERWPQDLPFAELVDTARARLGPRATATAEEQRVLSEELLRGYAAGVVDLRPWTPSVAAIAGERPFASPLARHQATLGGPATSLLHMRVGLDAYNRALLPLLDGTRDAKALLAAMIATGVHQPAARPDQPIEPAEALRRNLFRLAKVGLLVR